MVVDALAVLATGLLVLDPPALNETHGALIGRGAWLSFFFFFCFFHRVVGWLGATERIFKISILRVSEVMLACIQMHFFVVHLYRKSRVQLEHSTKEFASVREFSDYCYDSSISRE